MNFGRTKNNLGDFQFPSPPYKKLKVINPSRQVKDMTTLLDPSEKLRSMVKCYSKTEER